MTHDAWRSTLPSMNLPLAGHKRYSPQSIALLCTALYIIPGFGNWMVSKHPRKGQLWNNGILRSLVVGSFVLYKRVRTVRFQKPQVIYVRKDSAQRTAHRGPSTAIGPCCFCVHFFVVPSIVPVPDLRLPLGFLISTIKIDGIPTRLFYGTEHRCRGA